ncbi:hypothetical protein AHMF7605_15440 [Adhaeribacter arboris]|uniref:Uncharacterized protein n=1 Tax=Adhaeribacter arboris TaxID=2072846 RepID=A0A2T2YH58_9BACT|nr:hypothetical protein [Adhaeribacter arboris]PSR54798.1 hypothetical protein AHMF7605_15440 [Adhaeribacter arboris]
MKLTATLVNVFAGLLVVGGIFMRIYNLPDDQISLTVSLFGVLIYILAAPEHSSVYRRKW